MIKPMKICLVSDQLVGCHQNWSGAEIVCQYFTQVLKREKYEVVFITTKFQKTNVKEKIFPIPVINTKSLFLKKLLSPFSRVLGFFYSLYYLAKEKPDIVNFFHSNYLFISVMTSARLLRIPTVFTVLDYFILCSRNNLRMDNGHICDKLEDWRCLRCLSFFKILERFIVRFLTKGLDGIITLTETSKSRLIHFGFPKEKIMVLYIYNLPDEFVIEDKKRESKSNNILFVGTFFEYKGLQILIRAMSKVVSEISESRLMVVGTGYSHDKKRIENIIRGLGLENYVKFLGQKKNEEVLDLILKSEVVVVPEQWPSDFGPLILVEAMVMAKPVVASKIGAIPEFIKDGINGFLVNHNQPEQFAERIIWLLKNKVAAKAMAESAQKNVKFLFNQNQSNKVFDLYNSIYGKRFRTKN